MSTGICYTGTANDASGYGSSNRADITSLYMSGLDITTQIITQVPEVSNNGWTGELCKNLANRKIPYRIKIIHLTPDLYPKYMEQGKYNIGRLMWETDKLPQEWIDPINKMQEIWTSSPSLAEVFRKSGVKVPIYWFPQPIDIDVADRNYDKFQFPNHKGLMFYSVFQWIERKNPKGLLQAYWEAFSGREDVSLVLKTYRITYEQEEYGLIKEDIARWKREIRLMHYPRVYLITKLLSFDDVMKLHFTGDCYVSADHGEGWCRPLQEALLMGKPAITTISSGLHEYLNDDFYYPVPAFSVPVVNQTWIPWYTEDQHWLQPDKEELKNKMKFVFLNKELAQVKGFQARDYIKNKFNYTTVGNQMKKRLEKIQEAF